MPGLRNSKMSFQNSLIVKHFPSELSIDQREELLKLHGAIRVKCMPDDGPLKFTAFATFASHDQAKHALSKLHQLEIFRRHLVVEYTKIVDQKHVPHESDFPRFKKKQVENIIPKISEKERLKLEMEDFFKSIHNIAPSLGLDYMPSPSLWYKYPDPTPSIIANITHALVAVPKFYTQVLHLMNKMNLPPPFGPVTPAPPLPPSPPHITSQPLVSDVPEDLKDSLEVEEMDVTSSEEESELESDADDKDQKKSEQTTTIKRHLQQPKGKQKKCKLQQLLVPPTSVPLGTIAGAKSEPSDIFELHGQLDGQKKIQFNIKPTLDTDKKDFDTVLIQKPDLNEEGGFGVLAPSMTDSVSSKVDEHDKEVWSDSNFITLEELRRKHISQREMRTMSVFKNYHPGEPTFRLYVKNLAKQVNDKDLHYIFGRFIDWDSENDKNMFDIRLMKEGRMKGQAFITLAHEKQAIEAVKETNGFVLHTKPLVVQFARSAKPKEVPTKTQKKS